MIFVAESLPQSNQQSFGVSTSSYVNSKGQIVTVTQFVDQNGKVHVTEEIESFLAPPQQNDYQQNFEPQSNQPTRVSVHEPVYQPQSKPQQAPAAANSIPLSRKDGAYVADNRGAYKPDNRGQYKPN